MRIAPYNITFKSNYFTEQPVNNKNLTEKNSAGNFETQRTSFPNADFYTNYLPNINLSFKGAQNNLRKMTALAPDGTAKMLKKDSDGSYLVDPETVTRLYYGKNAEEFLNKTTVFKNQTQVICPNDGELLVEANGKQIPVISDGAVVLDKGKEAKITVKKGNPLVITSERAPVWYEEYTNNPKNKMIKAQHGKLCTTYWHFYSGHIKISDIGEEITNKLVESEKAEIVSNNHIQMKNMYSPEYQRKDLEGILTDDEFAIFLPRYQKARDLKLSTKEARKMHTDGLKQELLDGLIKTGLVIQLKEKNGNRMYWRQLFENENHLRLVLQDNKFSREDQDEIVKHWQNHNRLGFDFTGIKYLDEGMAVYCLKDRVNNMTGGSQHWDTTSFVASSIDEFKSTPFIGVSAKHSNKEYEEPTSYKQIRASEMLHSHPAELTHHLTEVYLVTDGAGALTIIEDNKPKTVVLKHGEGLVLQPGVRHCMTAFLGKYEHLVCQIPSIFHYGLSSKIDHTFPDGYSESQANESALEKLSKINL